MRLILLTIALLFSINTLANEHPQQGDYLGAKAVELPNWFKTTFMDLSEDLAEADDDGKHVMIYFHQNGCPYCAKLVKDNFHDTDLVAKLQKNFDTIETNMWGNRELTDWQGDNYSEKEFATKMGVQFTPTLIFLSPKGKTLLRLNGYQSIDKMQVALDYIANKHYLNQSYAHYINQLKKHKTGQLNANPMFKSAPHLLNRNKNMPAQQYLAVFFEEPNCPECDTFHQTIMPLAQTKTLLKNMHVIQLNALSDAKLITPSGQRTTAKDWYEALKLTYKPAVVFFDKQGKEIIRKDAFFKKYHFTGIIEYVATESYQHQPNFQRYLEERSSKLRKQGITVDIWQ